MKRNFCGFLDAKPCLNFSSLVFRRVFAWSFSMLFARAFRNVISVDESVSNSAMFHGVFTRD